MELNSPIVPNERAAIGGNNPPEDKRTTLTQLTRELMAAGSAWINQIKEITSAEQADRAAAFKRQCHDAIKQIDAQKAKEKRPHLDANTEIEKFFKDLVGKLTAASDPVEKKLTAWQLAEKARIKKEEEEARKLAAQKEAEAEAAADRAYEVYEQAERGELAGTSVNTVEAMADATAAREAADKAKADVERVASKSVKAGGQYTVGGVKRSVSLRTYRHLSLDLPSNCPPKVIATALSKLVPYIAQGGELEAIEVEIIRLANRVFSKTGEVPLGCKVVETHKSV